MGGAEFTRSGQTDKPNATIIGVELLGLAERGREREDGVGHERFVKTCRSVKLRG